MPISGKYDFKGLKSMGARGLKLALASTPSLAWLLRFDSLVTFLFEALSNYLANKGLVLINLGAIFIDGKIDQGRFDKAIDEALSKAKAPGLTKEQIKAIDDSVIEAARNFIIINKPS